MNVTSQSNITLTLTLIIKIINKFSARNFNLTIEIITCPKERRVSATIVGLGFLDTALNQYSEDARIAA